MALIFSFDIKGLCFEKEPAIPADLFCRDKGEVVNTLENRQ
jgi:hypothetical protein